MLPIASYHTANFYREATPDELEQRIDRSLLKLPMRPPKHLVQRLLRKGRIQVNGKKIDPSYRLREGDILAFPQAFLSPHIAPPNHHIDKKLNQIGIDLLKNVLWEDDALLICNKPAGIAVHGGTQQTVGLISALRHIRPDIIHLNLVHRLDKPTSGILIFSKTLQALRKLHAQFLTNHVKKTYLAILYSPSTHLSNRWEIDKKIDKSQNNHYAFQASKIKNFFPEPHQGKMAQTTFSILERINKNILLTEISPKQGRNHQIRIHAAQNQQIILGDAKYLEISQVKTAARAIEKHSHQHIKTALNFLPKDSIYLHAYTLSFVHPDTEKKITIHAPLPHYWKKCLESLGAKSQY